MKKEVTFVQKRLAMIQQSSFLLPQLPTFLEQPLDWKRAGGQIKCAGIMLGAILHGVLLIQLYVRMFGL